MLVEIDALWPERTEMKLSPDTQEHEMSAQGVSSRGEREEVYVFVNAIVARSRFFFFFRSRERGEIKSDCGH